MPARTEADRAATRVRGTSLAVGALALLAATGIALVALPADLSGQATLLVHVGTGLVAAPLLAVFAYAHARRLAQRERGMARNLAWLATGLLAAVVASGVALAVSYALGHVPGAWVPWLHAAPAALLLVLLPVHVVRRAPAPAGSPSTGARRAARATLGGVACALAVTGLLAALLDEGDGLVQIPDDHPRTPDGSVFAASFTETVHGGFVAPERLTGSADCGACHAEIFAEWSSSVHRFSGVDNPLIEAATRPAEERGGPAAARFCAACHEPVALLAGGVADSVFDAPPDLRETGVTCMVCHGIQRVPASDGNGRMQYAPPDGFALRNRGSVFTDAANRVLVAGFREAHRAAMTPPVLRTSHQCSSCHTVNAHEGLNGFGFLRLHNENDDWGLSSFARGVGPDAQVVGCRDCHMGRVADSDDPVAPRRGGHRSHRFLAANTFVAAHLADAEQLAATERFLRGEAVPEEIRHLVPEGPPVALAIEAPESVAPGETLPISVVLENRGVGHAFPAGPNEVNEAWVEVRVRAADGTPLWSRGELDADGRRDPQAFALVSVPVDEAGREIFVTGGLAAGFRTRRAILSGAADRERYEVAVPEVAPGSILTVSARLRYRKADAEFAALLPGFDIQDVPITDLVSAERRVLIRPSTAQASAMVPGVPSTPDSPPEPQ